MNKAKTRAPAPDPSAPPARKQATWETAQTTGTEWSKGYVQVYTGNGKGKTTAALGLAMRAAGAGLKVYIGQFVKGMHYSELEALGRFRDCIEINQFGRGCFIHGPPEPEDLKCAQQGLRETRRVLEAARHNLVILDEANIATHFGLISVEDLLLTMEARPPHVELIITGRCADKRVLDRADLVTEMVDVKHYYTEHTPARKGIEY